MDYEAYKINAQKVHSDKDQLEFDVEDVQYFDDLIPIPDVKMMNLMCSEQPVTYFNYADRRLGTPPFFGTTLKEDGWQNTLPFWTDPIINGVKKIYDFEKPIRMHLNCQVPAMYAGPHYDFTDGATRKTAMLMLGDSEGGDFRVFDNATNLNEVKRVPFANGRVVIFPSHCCHEGLPPKSGYRMTLAFVFEPKSG